MVFEGLLPENKLFLTFMNSEFPFHLFPDPETKIFKIYKCGSYENWHSSRKSGIKRVFRP